MPLGHRNRIPPKEAFAKLQDLCNRGEYCTWELRERLRKWGISSANSDKIIHLLERDRLVDDARYAEVMAHTKAVYNHWGRFRIRLFLRTKRISSSDIEEAIGKISPEEYITALKLVVEAKRRQLGEDADTYEGRCKILRHAVSKGYESDLIIAAVKGELDER